MSLIDELSNTLSGANSNAEQSPGVLKLALDLINSPEIGGIGGLVKTFQEKGFGEIVSSWVGTGQNLPISAEQIQHVLDNETLKSLIASTGMSQETVSSSLSNLLPLVIDKLTPNGEIDETGGDSLLAQGFELLKNHFLSPAAEAQESA